MSDPALIAKLKQRGYWKVTIHPLQYQENRYGFLELKQLIEKTKVSLRGWDYPHLDRRTTFNRDGFIESYSEFDYLIEYWRFYRSGKFIHLFGMREDGRDKSLVLERFRWYGHDAEVPENLRGLSIIAAVYSLTEIFEFAIRLANHGVFESGVRIEVELFGLRNRMLYFEDFGRDLRKAYVCRDEHIKREAVFKTPSELTESGRAMAVSWFIEIAHQFQWDSPPRAIMEEEQRKFLERRI
jgi:hypothetical protein